MAQIHQAKGQKTEALIAIAEAAHTADRYQVSTGTTRDIRANQAQLWIKAGQIELAQAWAEGKGLHPGTAPVQMREYEALVLARLCMAQYATEQAIDLLETRLRIAERRGRKGRSIETLTLLALAQKQRGEEGKALSNLTRALTMAEAERYCRTFVDGGRAVEALLRKIEPNGFSTQYVSDLIAAFETGPARHEGGQARSQPVGLVEPLSHRELEVLERIAEGLSNREVAEVLFITVGTVKWHTNNIYGKLGVSNRTQAIVRAQELGII
jgi:LuxR family maltose regulon positive regulatory protein